MYGQYICERKQKSGAGGRNAKRKPRGSRVRARGRPVPVKTPANPLPSLAPPLYSPIPPLTMAAIDEASGRRAASCFFEVGQREIGSSSSRRISGSEVRVGQLKQGGGFTTKQIGEHHDRAHKMALEPGSPHILYSCGEDGLVQHFDLRSDSPTKLLTCYSFSNRRRRVRLNTIAIDPQNPNYFSIGGSDEYVRLYDFRKINLDSSSNMNLPVDTFCPEHLLMGGKVHITGIAYSYSSELLVSYNDELIYLFENYMGLGPNPESTQPEHLDKLEQLQSYSGHRNFRTVKGVSFFGPNNEYVLSGSDCGHLFIWRKNGGELMRIMRGDKHIVNCIEPYPHFPFLATSGIDSTIKIWTPSSSKVMQLPQYANKVIASNARERQFYASRGEMTLSADVMMRILRLQNTQSELYANHEPSAADFATGGDETFFIGLGDGDGNQRSNSDPRERIVT
ncbi:hypothetical protein VPH35_078469 [Triticum aestivum]